MICLATQVNVGGVKDALMHGMDQRQMGPHAPPGKATDPETKQLEINLI